MGFLAAMPVLLYNRSHETTEAFIDSELEI